MDGPRLHASVKVRRIVAPAGPDNLPAGETISGRINAGVRRPAGTIRTTGSTARRCGQCRC